MREAFLLRLKHYAIVTGGFLLVAFIMVAIYEAVLLFDVYVVQRLGIR